MLLYYDSAALELVEQKVTATENVQMPTFENGRMAIAFSKAVKNPGKVATFKMKVKSGAALGSVTITGNLSVNHSTNGAVDAEVVSCKVKVVCAHKYDNNCDATCNLCGETRKITHTWDKGKVTTKAGCTTAGEKLYTCKVCGDTKTEALKKTGHSYDNACDTTCNNCGETRKITHDYGKIWTTDESQHWHACSVCGEKKDTADHNFTEVLTGAAEGHGYACTGCGYLSQVQPHTFDNACDTLEGSGGTGVCHSHSYSCKYHDSKRKAYCRGKPEADRLNKAVTVLNVYKSRGENGAVGCDKRKIDSKRAVKRGNELAQEHFYKLNEGRYNEYKSNCLEIFYVSDNEYLINKPRNRA